MLAAGYLHLMKTVVENNDKQRFKISYVGKEYGLIRSIV
jgi:RNA:NAD 2'-phosphotransferase (TPT1/KptA family)